MEHRFAHKMHQAELKMLDPGNAGTITIERTPAYIPLVSAGAETRTLARPTREGVTCNLHMKTHGGDITLTVTGGFNVTGDTTFTFSAVGQFATFLSCYDGTNFYWRLVSHYALANASPTEAAVLDGITATVTELNNVCDSSARPVAAGGANLTVTAALHDGKTILLDQATGTAVTLPAMTGSGSRYRFVVTVTKSGGSDVITATGAHLFGGVFFNTDTAAGTLFTAVAAANSGGSTTITLDGTTKGGRKGDWIEIEDVATSIGIVRGSLNGSGTEATPFA